MATDYTEDIKTEALEGRFVPSENQPERFEQHPERTQTQSDQFGNRSERVENLSERSQDQSDNSQNQSDTSEKSSEELGKRSEEILRKSDQCQIETDTSENIIYTENPSDSESPYETENQTDTENHCLSSKEETNSSRVRANYEEHGSYMDSESEGDQFEQSNIPTGPTATKFVHIFDDHSESLREKLHKQWVNGQHCDLKVKVKDEEFKVHSCILAAFSPVIMFQNPEKQLLCLPDITYTAIAPLIRMMYTGILCIELADAASVAGAARYLMMMDIYLMCEDYMKQCHKSGLIGPPPPPFMQLQPGHTQGMSEGNIDDSRDEIDDNEDKYDPGSDERLTVHQVDPRLKLLEGVPDQAAPHTGYSGPTDSNPANMFKCSQCDKVCLRQSNLTRHMRIAHSELFNLKCQLCGALMNSELDLRNHFIEVHGKRISFECDVAGCSFRSYKFHKYSSHKQWHAENGNRPMMFDSKVEGMEREPQPGTSQVNQSQTSTTQVDPLQEGTMRTDPSQVGAPQTATMQMEASESRTSLPKTRCLTSSYGDLMYKCSYCGVEYEKQFNLTRHVRKFHMGQLHLQCKFCTNTTTFKKERELKDHALTVHGIENPFVCDEPGCTYQTNRYDKLTGHQRTHIAKEPKPRKKKKVEKHPKEDKTSSDQNKGNETSPEKRRSGRKRRKPDEIIIQIANQGRDDEHEMDDDDEDENDDEDMGNTSLDDSSLGFPEQGDSGSSSLPGTGQEKKCNPGTSTGQSSGTQSRRGTTPVVLNCPHCGLEYQNSADLNRHIKKFHMCLLHLKCRFCGISCRTSHMLMKHCLKEHDNAEPFECDFEGCNFRTHKFVSLNIHKRSHSGKTAREKEPLIYVAKTNEGEGPAAALPVHGIHKCIECGLEFERNFSLTQHIRRVHQNRHHIQCKFCDYNTNFRTEQQLRDHALEVHQNDKPFECDFADCTFKTHRYDNLHHHRFLHTDQRDYVCYKCGKACYTSSQLTSHQRTCFHRKEFLCDICGQAFNHAQSMRNHRRSIHGGEKPYKCNDCGKFFSDQRNMKRHQRIHENAFPYMCHICEKKYRHSNSLKEHMKKHSEVLSFSQLDSSLE